MLIVYIKNRREYSGGERVSSREERRERRAERKSVSCANVFSIPILAREQEAPEVVPPNFLPTSL